MHQPRSSCDSHNLPGLLLCGLLAACSSEAIPFLGAWITGAFAVLIALGTGGPSAALIIGITFIISNGTIQSAVNSWALGSSLRLHPVAVLLATMIGGTVAGLLGMVIGAPVLAACVKSIAAIRALRAQNTS